VRSSILMNTHLRTTPQPENKARRDSEWTEPVRDNPILGRKPQGSAMKNLRILIADDHDLVRRGIKSLIESRPEWQVCDEAHSGREAVTKAEERKPDIVVLDIAMPELNGLEAARRIRKVSPNSEILILSMHYSDQLIKEILDAGVRGFVVKSDSDRDLIIALETLSNHKPFFTSMATEVMLTNFQRPGSLPAPGEMRSSRLTSREREIVQLLSEGRAARKWPRHWASASRPRKRTGPTSCGNWKSIPSASW